MMFQSVLDQDDTMWGGIGSGILPQTVSVYYLRAILIRKLNPIHQVVDLLRHHIGSYSLTHELRGKTMQALAEGCTTKQSLLLKRWCR